MVGLKPPKFAFWGQLKPTGEDFRCVIYKGSLPPRIDRAGFHCLAMLTSVGIMASLD
jgi:hypothetical protein